MRRGSLVIFGSLLSFDVSAAADAWFVFAVGGAVPLVAALAGSRVLRRWVA